VLDRQYLMGSYTWTTAQAAGTTIATQDFPTNIWTAPVVANFIKQFHNFKAGLRFSLRIQGSKFVYGKLLVAYTPDRNMNGYYAEMSNIYIASGYQHMLVSASAAETATFDVPFISNQRSINIKNGTGLEMGTFLVIVLNPLYNINGVTDSVSVVITAQFVGAVVFLPVDPSSVGSEEDDDALVVIPWQSYSRRGKPLLLPDPPREHVETNSLVTRVCNFSKRDFPLEDVETHSKREAAVKAMKGAITDEFASRVPTRGTIKAPSFWAPYKDLAHDVLETVTTGAALLSIIGLNKPTTVQEPGKMELNPIANWSAGEGIDMANKAAMSLTAGISTEPNVGGVNRDEMDLLFIACTPQMTSQFSINAATPDTLVATTNPFQLLAPYTYVDFLIRSFRFCSGSYKFRCYITASVMHSARLVFYLSRAVGDWQSCYHKVVDVNGDTEFEFVVPYCVEQVLRNNETETEYWNVYMHILSYSQPVPGVTTPIAINVYKAANTDFRFGCLLENTFVATSCPRDDFAKEFQPLHPSIKGYLPDKIVYPEEYRSLREILHRDVPYGVIANGNTARVYQTSGFMPTVGTSVGYYGKEYWGLLFMFWRGSTRHTYLRFDTKITAITVSFADTGSFVPGLDISLTDKPTLKIEVPWYSAKLYEATSVADSGARLVSCLNVTTGVYCSSVGDDFSFHYLRPVPLGVQSRPTAVYGYGAIVTKGNT